MKLTYMPDEKLRITESSVLMQFMYGGNAEMTLVGPEGTAHTYLIAKPRNSSEFPVDIRFVYVLHDTDTKFYLGMIEDGKFRCTRNSRFDESCETVKGAAYIVRLAHNQRLLDTSLMRLYQSGRCARCGRLLDSESAIKRGFGRSCYAHHLLQTEMGEKILAQYGLKSVQ